MLWRTDNSATQRRRATIFRPATAAAHITYDRHISKRQSLNAIFTWVNPSIGIKWCPAAVVAYLCHWVTIFNITWPRPRRSAEARLINCSPYGWAPPGRWCRGSGAACCPPDSWHISGGHSPCLVSNQQSTHPPFFGSSFRNSDWKLSNINIMSKTQEISHAIIQTI